MQVKMLKTLRRKEDRRRNSLSLYVCGIVLLSISVSLIPSVILAIVYGESIIMSAIPMLIGASLGFMLISMFRMPESVSPVNVLYMLGSIWATTIFFGAVPYMFSGIDFCSAVFESTSGYTTTGGSAIADLGVLTQSILFYRVTTNWLGGIIIIISVMILLPMVGSGNRSIISNEVYGSGIQNMQMRIRDAATQFIYIYILLTLAQVIILILLSVSPLDAVSIAFATISTGGFSSFPMTDFNMAIDFVITLFMFLGATNFYLHFRAIYGKKLSFYKKNTEFMAMTMWYLFASTTVFLIAYYSTGMSLENYINSMFMVVSAGTTTGFACTDYTPWPIAATILIFIVAIVGGSSGSTAGGIKLYRVVILFKYVANSITSILNPRLTKSITVGGQKISTKDAHSALNIITLFLVTILVSTFIFMLLGLDLGESLTSVITAMTNYGPGINEFGPMSSFATMSPILKLLMSLLMWMGRLEVALALAMFLPSVMKEQARDVKNAFRNAKNDTRL